VPAEDSTNNANDVSYTYDQSGSQATVTRNGQASAYRWDLRNRMIGIDTNNDGVDETSYGYDAGNQRIGQTTAGVTTSFFNDRNNPSGYPQVLEQWSSASGLERSYILGHRPEAQADAQGIVYIVRDGHGSTRALTDVAGLVIATYDYAAYGEAIGFDPAAARTVHLFGGDAEYDPSSSFYYHDRRWRDTHRFISFDDYEGRNPLNLHKYAYALADPIAQADPTGLTPNRADAVRLREAVNVVVGVEQKHPPSYSQIDILDEVQNIYDGAPSYIYTTMHRWIDLNHFYTAAHWTNVAEWILLTLGYAEEVGQFVGGVVFPYGDGVGSSAFTSEDPPSNALGVQFGNFLVDSPLFPPLSRQLERFLGGSTVGAVDPETAPDWSSLPANEQAHEMEWIHDRENIPLEEGIDVSMPTDELVGFSMGLFGW
jgi:RHS repeat-associated protein